MLMAFDWRTARKAKAKRERARTASTGPAMRSPVVQPVEVPARPRRQRRQPVEVVPVSPMVTAAEAEDADTVAEACRQFVEAAGFGARITFTAEGREVVAERRSGGWRLTLTRRRARLASAAEVAAAILAD